MSSIPTALRHYDRFANNVFIYDGNGVCDDNTTSIQCLSSNGGAFDENRSSSWTLLDVDKDNPVKETRAIDTSTDIYGSDSLALGQSLNLPGFNFYIPRKRSGEDLQMCTLGLGSDSTILSELKRTNQIPSRSWSLYQGLTGEDPAHQLDGGLILGGLDQAKVKGENYTTQLAASNSNCPTRFLVTVTNIEMDIPGQGSISIIGASRGSALQMCISPGYRLMTLPYDISQNFYGNATGTNIDYGQRALGLNLYAGDLSFTLSSGLKVSIPNDQLVVPDISIAADGTTVYNSSVREIMVNSLQEINSNDMPLLGHTFLSQVYMNVNYDLNIFSLWSARATGEEDLVSIGPGGSLGCGKGAPARPGNVTMPPDEPSGSNDNNDSKGSSSMSSGTKAGIAVGAIAGVAFLVAIFLTLRYYKRRHKLGQYTNPENAPSASFSTASAAALPNKEPNRRSYTKAELPAETQIGTRLTSWHGSATGSSNRGGWQQSTTEQSTTDRSSNTHASPSLLEMRDLPPASTPISELASDSQRD
ncbi:MAG: hypothetical protein Q9160_005866 [Pyrenula sp. 1 TL-2023]